MRLELLSAFSKVASSPAQFSWLLTSTPRKSSRYDSQPFGRHSMLLVSVSKPRKSTVKNTDRRSGVVSALLAAGFLEMRGVAGRSGWFWLFVLEGLLTIILGMISFVYLPSSPTRTRSLLFRSPWYTEREEVVMINRILRDDPAKGLTALKEPATLQDVKAAWSDKSLWGLYLIGMIAYIPATPVQAYLTLTLKRVGGFSTLASNLLTAPSAALQIVTMLALAYSSDYFNDRAFHCLFGQLWSLPMFVSLLTLSDGGQEWGRFSLVTLISGYPYFHPIVTSWISENSFDVKKRAIAAATYNVFVQMYVRNSLKVVANLLLVEASSGTRSIEPGMHRITRQVIPSAYRYWLCRSC